MIFSSQSFNQITGVDIYRAGSSTKTIYSTGIYSIILVLIQQQLMISMITGQLQVFQYSSDNNSSPGCSGNITAGAYMFAITTFNTTVNFFFNRGHCFQMLNMCIGIFIYDNTRIKQVMRIN